MINLNLFNQCSLSTAIYRLFIILFLTILLNSCAIFSSSVVTPIGDDLAQKQAQQLINLTQWHVSGKIGYRLPDDTGSALIDWQQQKDNYIIHLSGPLNIGATTIKGNNKHAILTTQGKQYLSDSPELLFYESLGWPLPIEDITWWIKGLPAPSEHIANYDEVGLLKTLQQKNWLINFTGYTQVTHLYLPAKIIAQRDNIKLTFILKQWMINSDTP